MDNPQESCHFYNMQDKNCNGDIAGDCWDKCCFYCDNVDRCRAVSYVMLCNYYKRFRGI